jgi:hypothetical protein
MTELIHALELAAAGITAVTAGAALLIIRIVLGPGPEREVEDGPRSNL